MRKFSHGRQILFSLCVIFFTATTFLIRTTVAETKSRVVQPVVKKEKLNSRRSFGYLRKICRIGRRVSGSRGMQTQQKLLRDHFVKLGAEVKFQTFDIAHPISGNPVRLANMIVSWHPKSKKRVLIGCHYDTRPYPDEDPRNPRGQFIGANDGASGVALLMEMGHLMPQLKPTYGVDFIFFDAEELVYGTRNNQRGKYFLGSEYFAKKYIKSERTYEYLYGVIVDMVGDRNLQIYQDKNSTKYAKSLVDSIWSTAKEMKVKEFIPQEKYEIQDDHLALNRIARIPSIDIIDFDYRYWHTTRDVSTQCSGKSLVTVGSVLLQWLQHVPKPQ